MDLFAKVLRPLPLGCCSPRAMEVNRATCVLGAQSTVKIHTLKTLKTSISLEKLCPTLENLQISLWTVLIIFYFWLKIVPN